MGNRRLTETDGCSEMGWQSGAGGGTLCAGWGKPGWERRKTSLTAPEWPRAAPMPRFKLQIPPATEIGPRLWTWVARASRLSPPLRGQPPSQSEALEGRRFGGVDMVPAPSSRLDFICASRKEVPTGSWHLVGQFPHEPPGEGSTDVPHSSP